MELNMEWNVICRVCLQEGEMHSIFEQDENDMSIADKIALCSSLKIVSNENLPKQICSNCLYELNVAYEFRMKCESSNSVLQSFTKDNAVTDFVMCSVKGKVYKYEPPDGLHIKRIRKTNMKQELRGGEDDPLHLETSSEMEEYIVTGGVNEDSHGQQNQTEHYLITEIEESEAKKAVIRQAKTRESTLRRKGTTVRKEPKLRVKRDKLPCICELCGNSFKFKHALETHMRRHRNEKPFACEICGHAFVLNVELTCHMRTHTGQKPYACRFCDRRFADFGSRIKHERSHTGERPYACETCGKAFAYSYGLSSHMLIHTGEKRYECEKCSKRFTKKHHLTNHLKTHLKQENRLRAQQGLLELPAVDKAFSQKMLDTIQLDLTPDDNMVEYVEEVAVTDEASGNEFYDQLEQQPMIVYQAENE